MGRWTARHGKARDRHACTHALPPKETHTFPCVPVSIGKFKGAPRTPCCPPAAPQTQYDTSPDDPGTTPLHVCAWRGDVVMCRQLLAAHVSDPRGAVRTGWGLLLVVPMGSWA